MGWAMAEVYGAVTDQLLINLARYFPYIQSADQIRGSFEYQARMLAQLGQVNRESVDIILRGLNGADAALRQALETAIMEALRNEEPKLRRAAQKGLLEGGGMLPAELSPNQMQAFEAYYRQSADKLNYVNTVMLESTQAAYTATVSEVVNKIQRAQSILNIGAGEVITGVSTWNTAMRDVVRKMVQKGITGYVDHGGHKWSPEAYAAMDIRTTMFNTARAAVWEAADNYGADLYQVSSHNGARPLCYPWQGKVISRSGWSGEVQDLYGETVHVYAQNETSYGEAAGLFGVNCRHYPMTFIPGFSTQKGEPQDPEDNAQAYAESQQQRALERRLREEKRDLEVMKAQGAGEDEIQAQKMRVREASANIEDFCDETGRTRRRNREGAPVRTTWPGENGEQVTRFGGKEYIDANQVPPQKGAFALASPSSGNVASQATQKAKNVVQSIYGKPFASQGDPIIAAHAAEAEKILSGADQTSRKVWEKVSGQLQEADYHAPRPGAYYSRADGKTHFESVGKAFDESSYQRKNTVFFHEYGHNVDNLLSPVPGSYYSYEYQGNVFGRSILQECEERVKEFYLQKNGFSDAYEALKAVQNGPGGMGFGLYVRQALRGVMPGEDYRAIRRTLLDAGDDDSVLRPLFQKYLGSFADSEMRAIIHQRSVGNEFIDYVKNAYTIYERTDVSDMFQKYTEQHYGIDHPFGVGHDAGYFSSDKNLPAEAFAEMYSATITKSDSLRGIKDFFPKSFDLFLKMLGDAV